MPEFIAVVIRHIDAPTGRVSSRPIPYFIEDAADATDAERQAEALFNTEFPHNTPLPDGHRETYESFARDWAEQPEPVTETPLAASVHAAQPTGPVDLGRYGMRTPQPSPHGGYRWYCEIVDPFSGSLPPELFSLLAGGEQATLITGFLVRDYPAAEDAHADALDAVKKLGT